MKLSHYQMATVPFLIGLIVGVAVTALLFEQKYLKNYGKNQNDGFLHTTGSKSKNIKRDVIPTIEEVSKDSVLTKTRNFKDSHFEEREMFDSNRKENVINEMDLKQQIYVGVITAEKYLQTRAKAVNNTWGNQVDKIQFFAEHGTEAMYHIPVVNLDGISDKEYPPQKKAFKMIKHMCTYINEYEWFIRADDDVYIRVEKLRQFLARFDSNLMVYMGQPGHGVPEVRDTLGLKDRNFCMGGPGVMFNQAAMKALCPHIDECMQEVVSGEEDVELGRCVSNHIGIECVHAWGTLRDFYHSYEEEYTEEKPFLGNLAENTHIESAITLHHVKVPYIMYKIHRHFATKQLNSSMQDIKTLETKLHHNNLHLPEYDSRIKKLDHILEDQKLDDVNNDGIWRSFDATSIYGPSTSSTIYDITNSYLADLKQICETAIDHAIGNISPKYTFNYLLGGYFRSNSDTGTEYLVDVVFTEKKGSKMKQVTRIHLKRPLSTPVVQDNKTTVIEEGYTELFILVPTDSHQSSQLEFFLMKYFEPLVNELKKNSENKIKVTLIVSMLDDGLQNIPNEANTEPTIQDLVNWYRIKLPDHQIEIVRLGQSDTSGFDAKNIDQAFTRALTKAKTLSKENFINSVVVFSSLNTGLSIQFLEYCNLKTRPPNDTNIILQSIPFQLHPGASELVSQGHFSQSLLMREIFKLDHKTPTGYWGFNRNGMATDPSGAAQNIYAEINPPICANLQAIVNLQQDHKISLNRNIDVTFPILFQNIYANNFQILRYVENSLINIPR